MKKILMILGCCGFVGLAGCGPVREARNEFQQSASNYKACIEARGVAGCEREKALLDVDERRLAGVSGNSNSDTVTVRR